jgi:hypothetical protein
MVAAKTDPAINKEIVRFINTSYSRASLAAMACARAISACSVRCVS